ncbi:MAG: aldehyde dehydrogenase [Anaerovoracaceae bacterium]|jgi:gamma-glutamyl-gamma-aminobutyraldehyde dehydrogenase
MESREYYQKVADGLKFDTDPFINGKFVKGSGPSFDTVNPATGKVVATLSSNTEEEVYEVEKIARKAFNSGVWSKADPAHRKEVLVRLGDLMLEHRDELSVMETLDSGKPIFDNYNGDLPESAETFKFHAEAIDKLQDYITAGDSEHLSMVVREPLGVVAAITPWNFPMEMVAWKLAPILAAGNSVILKPASLTPLTALKIAELSVEAGVPAGVLNVVLGSGRVVGNALAEHPDIEALTFTGSTSVGKRLLVQSGQTNAKRIFLEMGGKNPCVVMPDVKDLDHAAEEAVNACFWNMGENCTSNARLIVHKSIIDEFTKLVIEKTKALTVGDPLDPVNHQGALVELPHMESVLKYIGTGKSEGAKLVCGGHRILEETGGNFVEPTIFTDVTRDMTIWREEIFGPVLSIMPFETEEEAIEIANDTEYGLQASLFTDDLSTAHRMSRALQAGTVSVNCYAEGDIGTPFGGFKQSGFMGRDNSVWANRQYTELKTIWMKI